MIDSSKYISVIGLGKLGLPLVGALASRGFRVLGYDKDAAKLEAITKGFSPFEPGLEEYLQKFKSQIEFTRNCQRIAETPLTYVVVPTPSLKNGSFSLKFVRNVLGQVGRALKRKNSFHTVVVVSTVLPGDMEILKACLEKASGKRCGTDFGLCYNPAFIALGNVIHNFLYPDFVLIGQSDERSGAVLENLYTNFCLNHPKIHRMNFINAELTKISVNTFVTMKISFGNVIARLCERLPDADAEIVAKALGDDSRIGSRYLKGALGYGGPCFPRDNRAFIYMASQFGLKASVASATDEINDRQLIRLEKKIKLYLKRGQTVGILGLAYKPDTNVIDSSPGMMLAERLVQQKIPVSIFDPLAMENARIALEGQGIYASTCEDCVRESDVIVIINPCAEFKKLKPSDFETANHEKVLIDCWRLLDETQFGKSVKYVALGKNRNHILEE